LPSRLPLKITVVLVVIAREVGRIDPDYLTWMLESGEFLEDVQQIVKFPPGLIFSE
jgi:hypothetical protein